MLKTALTFRHIHFEDLGVFESVLETQGYAIEIVDAPLADLSSVSPVQADLLIVLGGPVGVGDVAKYPFIRQELAILSERLAAGRPTLGICLGAQLMAAALGAEVRPLGVKEIGFAPVRLTAAGRAGPLRWLEGAPVLHWHGDMFEIPPDGLRLAETDICANQAFAVGAHALGLQFHPEPKCEALEPWLVGHAVELGAAGIDPAALRVEALAHAADLASAARAMLADWLSHLKP